MGSNSGYVYVMINPSYGEGLVKIGKTTKEPEERAKELSSATGVVTPFILVYKRLFKNCHTAERLIHSILEEKGHKVNSNREFFAIGIPDAISYIMQLPDEDDELDEFEDTSLEESDDDLAEFYFNMAEEYANGSEDTFQDDDLAIEYYEKSAALGKVEAYHSLGMLLRYAKGNNQSALKSFHNAANRGYWRSYAVIANIYEDTDFRGHNQTNADLAWKKYFESVKLHIDELDEWDWHMEDVGRNFLHYTYNLLSNGKTTPELIDELAFTKKAEVKMAFDSQISWFEDNGYEILIEPYEQYVGKYISTIEEKVLLSAKVGDDLGKNYCIIAEKYFYGNDGYKKDEYKALTYWKESNKLGYKRSLIYVGLYWLTQSSHTTPVTEAWRDYYNSIYDKVADDEVFVSDEEKLNMVEGFFEMFNFAKEHNGTHLLENYYYMMALNLGMINYITNQFEEVSKLSEEIQAESRKFEGKDFEDTPTSEIVARAELLVKQINCRIKTEKVTAVHQMIKDFFADFQARNTDPNPQMHRL